MKIHEITWQPGQTVVVAVLQEEAVTVKPVAWYVGIFMIMWSIPGGKVHFFNETAFFRKISLLS